MFCVLLLAIVACGKNSIVQSYGECIVFNRGVFSFSNSRDGK